MRAVVIAEAGVNHNGSLATAKRLVDVAAEAGADIVKFQTFNADRLATATAPKANYQKQTSGAGETQHQMLRRLQLSKADHAALIAHCASRGIEFLSTPFDAQSLAMLVNDFNLQMIKLGSGEITNGPLLLAAARTARRLILSTGMATLDEVEMALGVIAFGHAATDARPSESAFKAAFANQNLREVLKRKVVLLHCTTEYPAPFEDVNLLAMDAMRDAFDLPVGYSDHTKGIGISIAAAARGAVMIEKHFTLDRSDAGPDHAASLEPDELITMVRAIREVEAALGDGVKGPRPSELANLAVARKSIVASRAIRIGEALSDDNMTVKRPGNGIPPMKWWDIAGQRVSRPYTEDEAIES